MITKLRVAILGILLCGSAKAQWTQIFGWSEPVNFSIPDTNVFWASTSAYTLQYGKNYYTRSVDGGVTLKIDTIIGSDSTVVSNVVALDSSTAWFSFYKAPAGNSGKIIKTSDGGQTWVTQTNPGMFTPPSGFLNFVHFFDQNRGLCMGDPNGGYFEIYTSSNGGTTWIRTPQVNIPAQLSGEYGITGVFSAIDSTLWFGTNKGRVYKSADFGNNWTVATAGTNNFINDMTFQDLNHGIVRTNNKIKRTSDGGQTWASAWQTLPYTLLSAQNNLAYIPGTPSAYIMTIGVGNGYGSAISYDTCYTWMRIDSLVHKTLGFHSLAAAYTGSVYTALTYFKFDQVTFSVPEITGTVQVNVFPNPASDILNVSIDKANPGFTLSFKTMLGQELLSKTIRGQYDQVSLAEIPGGVYLLQIKTNEGALFTRKVQVLK